MILKKMVLSNHGAHENIDVMVNFAYGAKDRDPPPPWKNRVCKKCLCPASVQPDK